MHTCSEKDCIELALKANDIRQTVVEMLAHAGSGHLAGSLDMADIFAALYFHLLRHNPEDPEWGERDRLILSNGHIAPVRYAAMAHAGYFSIDDTVSLRSFGSPLQGHPERTRMAGLETTSGPLGDGLTQAVGIALGLQMDDNQAHTYVVMSDAEQQCGITWEAVGFAGARALSNITAIIDRNNIQISGLTREVLPIEPLAQKYEACNWRVVEVDGHNIEMFIEAVHTAQSIDTAPTVIIAHTVAGKGVPEIEGDYRWHGKVPTHEEAQRFLKILRHARDEILHNV